MSQPAITVVTPSYNQGAFIRATIESVLSQDYGNLEYIVMDGGSTDETAAVVKDYASRITWISERDRGQSHAINKGFRMARGESVGKSLVERDKLDLAKALMAKAGDRLVLPIDHVVADKLDASAKTQIVTEIPDGWIGVDIGPKTRELYAARVAAAATILWNGPMGKFEDEPFRAGTVAVANALAARTGGGVTVVGGGESAEAVEEFGLAEKMTHVSTGGGAFLEYVEGKPFAALAAIDEA